MKLDTPLIRGLSVLLNVSWQLYMRERAGALSFTDQFSAAWTQLILRLRGAR